jgi:hypothetical protein
MNLKEYISFAKIKLDDGVNPYLTMQNLYEDIVKKIRLYPHFFSVKSDKCFSIDGLNIKNKFVIDANTSSEICFKDIVKLHDATFANFDLEDNATSTDLNVYDVLEFPLIEYTNPVIKTYGNKYYCETEDNYFGISAYAYPYFVYTSNGPFVDVHKYSINDMVTLYTDEELIVDELIGLILIPHYMAYCANKRLDIGIANGYSSIVKNMINTYNDNESGVRKDMYSDLRQIAEYLL